MDYVLDARLQDAHLFNYAKSVLNKADLLNIRPAKCTIRLLYAPRIRDYRKILNEDSMLAGIKEKFPLLEVATVDLAQLSFKDQLKEVRSSHIFMFPHGGAGPHVLWMQPNTVVIEVFPFKFADPMYRNLAVKTHKIYLAYQNRNRSLAHKVIWHGKYEQSDPINRNSNTDVDIEEMVHLVQSALSVVASSFADGWRSSSDLGVFDIEFCPWCSKESKKAMCKL